MYILGSCHIHNLWSINRTHKNYCINFNETTQITNRDTALCISAPSLLTLLEWVTLIQISLMTDRMHSSYCWHGSLHIILSVTGKLNAECFVNFDVSAKNVTGNIFINNRRLIKHDLLQQVLYDKYYECGLRFASEIVLLSRKLLFFQEFLTTLFTARWNRCWSLYWILFRPDF